MFGHWRVPAINTLHEAIDVALVPSVLKIFRANGGGGGGSRGNANGGGSRSEIIQFHNEEEWDSFIEERIKDEQRWSHG